MVIKTAKHKRCVMQFVTLSVAHVVNVGNFVVNVRICYFGRERKLSFLHNHTD